MHSITNTSARTEYDSAEYAHYIQLFNAFPNSYWTQSDRDAMAALYPTKISPSSLTILSLIFLLLLPYRQL